MARNANSCGRLKAIVVIWAISIFLIYTLFQMALRNSSNNSTFSSSSSSYSSEPSTKNRERRSRLYDRMEKDLYEHGAAFLRHGETSQSLSISDLFSVKDGHITPNLKAATPPVRANILYLSTEYATPISDVVKSVFSPYFEKAIWFQNSSLYHFSMVHASHHISPVHATEDDVESEARAVKGVVENLCPAKIVLDRVVLTSTGVLLGCWQVVAGTDPIDIRAKLKSVLPRAPEKQLYDDAILHTSFARVLGPPTISSENSNQTSDEVVLFHKLVSRLNDKIRGFEAVVSELWYVEELDILALALDGRMKVRKFKFGCSKS